MLTSPTVAVDARRVILIMPVGAILTVTSDTSAEKNMIEVAWEDRKLAMFGSDLVERGEENFQSGAVAQHAQANPEEIRQVLQEDFDAAQDRGIEASKLFAEVMSDIPSGIPHPDGTDRIRLASREYSASRDAATAAMKRLSDFLIRGIVSPELEHKPAVKETPNTGDKKFSKGA